MNTLRYMLRRGGFYLVAAWVALTMNFVIPRLMPGDPAATMFARFQGELDPEAMEALRETFGLTDAPLLEQYVSYLWHVAQGDLGVSVAYFPAPVSDVLATGLLWTLFLAGGAVIIAFVLGTGLGALAAWWRGGWLDSGLPPALLLLGAFPYFWLAMVERVVLRAAARLVSDAPCLWSASSSRGSPSRFLSSVHATGTRPLPAGTMVLASPRAAGCSACAT